jgi:hypothetical protein
MDTERWVWLEISVSSLAVAATWKSFYVPEAIIDHIPSYKDLLLKKAALINSWDEHTIRDSSVTRPMEPVKGAIRFLVSGFLAPLDTSSTTCDKTLDGLIELYKLSIELSIKCLEVAVLGHIDALNFEALPHQKFLGFARSYYSVNGVGRQNSSMGCLIKKKLSSLLPYLQKSMTIEEMSTETGILGKQLIAVLLERVAKVQAASSSDAKVKMENRGRLI